MTTFTLMVAVNGSETDTDVEADSASWTTKVGNIRIAGGYGGPVRTAAQWGLDIDIAVPIEVAAKVRSITIGIAGPWSASAPAWAVKPGGSTAYRIVFHGYVHSVQGSLLDGYLRFSCLDEMWNLLQRKARTSASSGSGCKGMIDAIDTAHSLSMSGSDGFPSSTDTFIDGSTLMQMYRPDQKDTSNGAFIQSGLAGTGVNMSAEWDGTITAPELWWRPDYFYPGVTTSRQADFWLPRPNLWNVTDCGYAYQDYAARYTVNGSDGTTDYYGWARIDDGTDRTQLGNRELSLTGYWNTDARCKAAALTILQQTGYPASLLPYRIQINVDHYAAGLTGWYGDEEATAWYVATAMLGDKVEWPISGDPEYESLTGLGLSSQTADDLNSMFITSTDNAGPNSAYGFTVDQWIIRGITRTWDPGGGWTVEFALQPDLMVGPNILTDTVSDAGSGSY